MQALEKLRDNIRVTGEKYFIDQSKLKIGGNSYLENFKLSMLWLAVIMSKKVLLVGEPGFGKTTATKVVLSAYSGLPYSLYESAQLQGHPEQVEEKLIGRPDYAKLNKEESVIWNKAIFLPGIIADEFNRLPAGKHAILLNSVETGRFNYLNEVLYLGQKPFFATANNQDAGTSEIMLPMLDRFAFVLEFGYIGSVYQDNIRNASSSIKKELSDEELTDKIIAFLLDTSLQVKEKVSHLEEYAAGFSNKLAPYGLKALNESDKCELRQSIGAVEISTDARIFLQCINSELNTTEKYGIKRSNDLLDDSTHAKNLASTNVCTGFSPRAIGNIEDLAKGIALLLGSSKVTKEHINAVAPYVMAHRLIFSEDFIAQNDNLKRENGDMNGLFLSKKILAGIEANYSNTVKGIGLIYHTLEGEENPSVQQVYELRSLLDDETKIDHPLTREYISLVKSVYREKLSALGLKVNG